MRRFSLLLAAAASAVTVSAVPTAANQYAAAPSRAQAGPAIRSQRPARRARPVAQNADPSGRIFYRDPVYTGGRVHPGFYGGFDRYGAVLPRGGSDTNVDVDVTTEQRGSTVPVVIAPPRADVSGAMANLRRENWRLRRSMEPDLSYLGTAATAQGEGSAELRELVGAIIARRDRQWQEKISGARVVAVDEYQRDLGATRREIRDLEARPRNKHILYLGFDD